MDVMAHGNVCFSKEGTERSTQVSGIQVQVSEGLLVLGIMKVLNRPKKIDKQNNGVKLTTN